jgi:DNA polymerase III subunit delta
MVALKASEVERFLARPKSEQAVVLVYGPDAGLVAERCDALAARQLGIPADPMGLIRLEGDEVASDPDRLLEEAHTIPLFGGERVIRLRLGSRSVQGPVQRLLDGPRPEALVLIEGGDLKRSHPVRTLCEKSPAAATLPCYPDAAADVARLVEQELGAAGFSVAADARTLLIGLLGGDRLASRQELRKLALYAHGQDRIEHADVEAAIADSTTSAVDKIVDAAFAGDAAETDLQMHVAIRAGISPGTIILAALRQALQLARLKADAGGSRGAAEAAMRYLPFPKKAAMERALGRWSQGDLDRAVQMLADATFESRKRFDLAESVVGRALVVVAAQAARRGRTEG